MALGKNITPAQGIDYYEKDDYYLKIEGGPELALRWGGKLADELGLSGKADEETWKAALEGHFPGGIEVMGGGFKDENGVLQKRAGTDFEFSAPKSVSIQALVHGDDRLIAAHREAVATAMAFLEGQVGARRGKDGKTWETTGKALIGRVTHLTSREGDPHLHDHAVFLNVTKNSDGKYQAMTNDRMMNYQRLVQEIYHAELSRHLISLGYEIESGRHGEPQIKGFSREQIEHFSGRASQIEAYIKDKWGIEWSKLSREERNAHRYMHDEAWERTRKAKTVKVFDRLQDRWTAEAEAVGAHKIEPGREKQPLPEEKRLEIARESLQFALDHHTEREAAVGEGELLRTALQAGRGKISFDDLRTALGEAEASGKLVRQKEDLAGPKASLVTSREALAREKRILKFEKDGRGAVFPILNPIQAEATLNAIQERDGVTLNAEQKAAAKLILTTENRYVGINGYAGVGKTTMLAPAVEALKDAGYKVIGLGPQHSAVHALRDAGIIEGRTLQSWLADRRAGEALTEKTVVVIDEAGLTNARDLESAMKRIEKAGARAVLVGDIKQYESVAAGPAFRQLQDAGMETARVTEMQRQNKAAANVREAARLSVDDPAKALEKLEIREVKNAQERYKALSEAYLKSPDRKETLVLTGTHEARRAVNENVRATLGLAGKGQEFKRFEAGDFTEAQKKRIDSYEAGQDIRFGKDYRSMGVRAGEVGKVATVDRENGTVLLEMEDGRSVVLTPRELSGKGHEIGQLETIELASGDRIRITGNALKKEGITNGTRGEVLKTDHDRILIRLDSGKEFDLKPGTTPLEIDHGYAQTGHSAQGLGAKTVILDLPSGSRTMNQRSFYTNLTRTKGEVVAFTDDRARLTGAVTRESAKSMALDVEKANKSLEKPSTKEKSMNDQERAQRLTKQEKERLEKWKEGMTLRFPQERKDLKLKAGETVKVEALHRLSGIVVLRDVNGRKINLEPQWLKKAREERALGEIEALVQKSQGEERRIIQEKIAEIVKAKDEEAKKEKPREKELAREKDEAAKEARSQDRIRERDDPKPEPEQRRRGPEMGL